MLQIARLELINKKLENELKAARKLLRTNLQINLSKDLKINQMHKMLKENSIRCNPEEFDCGQFKRFDGIFTSQELASFRGLDFGKSSDSSFLRLCIKALYRENLQSLAKKTIYGREERVVKRENGVTHLPAKERISPEKMVIVEEIFQERIDAIPNIDQFAKNRRKGNIYSVLARVIDRLCVDTLKSPRPKKFKFSE